MKLSKIALATSLAVASMSASAVSLGITAPAADHTFFISGASGMDGYLTKLIPSYLQTTEASYKYINTGATTKDYAWYGKLAAANFGLAQGELVLIYKRSTGGSAVGIGPLATSSRIKVVDINADATRVGTTTEYTAPLVSLDSQGLIPDVGLSDVEPKMFSPLYNNENGITPLTQSQLSTLTVNPVVALAEGIMVTNAVADTTVLSNNFIRMALSGGTSYQDWSKADGSSDPMIICRRIEGSGTQAAFNSYFNGYPGLSAYNAYSKALPAVVSESAGYNATKTAAEKTSSLSSADKGTGNSEIDPIIVAPLYGFTVAEGDGSGEVRKCMQAAYLKQDVVLLGRAGKYYKYKFSQLTNPGKAIGVASLDAYTKASTASAASRGTMIDGNGYARSTGDANGEWTFRNLNGAGVYDVKNQTATCATSTTTWNNAACSGASGIAPSRANILNSSYDFVVEPTLQMRTSSGTTSNVGIFYNKIKTDLAAPADVRSNSSKNSTPYAYGALPTGSSTKTTYNSAAETNAMMYTDLTRQGNTSSPLHEYK